MISEGGIILPDIAGIANLKPLIEYIQVDFNVTGYQYIYSSLVPANKVWEVTYLSVGRNVGTVTDVMIEVVDGTPSRKSIIAARPTLAASDSQDFPCSFWLKEGLGLRARFNVTETKPTCWLTIHGRIFDYGGDV